MPGCASRVHRSAAQPTSRRQQGDRTQPQRHAHSRTGTGGEWKSHKAIEYSGGASPNDRRRPPRWWLTLCACSPFDSAAVSCCPCSPLPWRASSVSPLLAAATTSATAMCFCGRDGTSWFAQLRLLLWKNWMLKKRRAGSSLCEILFPLGAICILIMIRALVTIDNVEVEIPVADKQLASNDVPAFLTSMACGIPSVSLDDIGASNNEERYPYETVALAPGPNLAADGGANNIHIQAIALQMREAFAFAGALAPGGQVPCCIAPGNNTYVPSCFTPITDFVRMNSSLVRTFDSGDAIDNYIQSSDYGWHDTLRTIALAAVIDRDPNHPSRWSYVLRANSSDIPWTGTAIDPLVSGYKKSDFFQYYNKHVLTLQWFVESYIVALAKTEAAAAAASTESSADAETPTMTQQTTEQQPAAPRASVLPPGWHDMSYLSFPVPQHRQDNFKQYVSQVFGLFLVIAFMWPFSRMVRNMVEEKEKKLSEGVSGHTQLKRAR